MPRLKLQRFEQNADSTNVIEVGKLHYKTIKGGWRRDYFGNDNPVVLELACGMGEYTVGLAQARPDVNFIGIDTKGERIARGSQAAQQLGLTNVAFLRADINFLTEFFNEREVNEIWIIFPDPHPHRRWAKHRLTHPRFLAVYQQLLVPGGMFHLKTDSMELFEYSIDMIQQENFIDLQSTTDLHNPLLNSVHQTIRTKYEQLFFDKGFTINYLQCITVAG